MQMRDFELVLVDEDVRLLLEKLRPIIEKTMRHQGWFRKQKIQPDHNSGKKAGRMTSQKDRTED